MDQSTQNTNVSNCIYPNYDWYSELYIQTYLLIMTHQSDWMIKIIPLIFIKKFNNMDNNLFTGRAIAEFDLPKQGLL